MEPPPLERHRQLREEQPPEQAGEHAHGEEESRPAPDPPLSVHGRSPARDHAVEMGVKAQGLSPGVQHGEEPERGAQMLRIRADGAQGLCGAAEEEGVHDRLVLVGDRRDLVRDGEDDVKILSLQQLGLAGLQPPRPGQGLALGAVAIAARVVGRARVPAGVTLLQVPTQGGGAAGCDRPHHPLLLLGAGVGRPVGGPVPAEHLRHFEPGPEHRPAAQKTGGGAGAGAGALGSGSRSKGLRVAHTVVVAMRR